MWQSKCSVNCSTLRAVHIRRISDCGTLEHLFAARLDKDTRLGIYVPIIAEDMVMIIKGGETLSYS